jgi:hypothetical protein
VALFVFAFTALAVPACGDDDDGVNGYCEDAQCECAGNDCVCPAAGDCGIACTADCDLQCAGSGACDFNCGEDCQVRCTGSGNCVADVGPRSHVDCPSNGNCEAFCSGACSMTCTGSGDCTLHCLEGEQPSECGDDTIACGGCP